ncbi:MAG: helicase-related protein [Acidobacteriota bacterium]|nr:helicase-related protein [Chloroflexota bacterium]MDE2897183.1 helicase-related protein [Chloroflexota bacterium]MDE2962944.1 helicase-related protein [Acidobacteriota bacterium]
MGGPYELLDNVEYGSHQEALAWLTQHYAGPLHVATGYVGLEGLDALADVAAERDHPARLLIGAAPEGLTGPPGTTVADRFEQSVSALRRERDFSAFPAARRAVLERVTGFFQSDQVAVRRYVRRFLHGKAYVIGELGDGGDWPSGPGAALVSSANLTRGGLVANLELGMVHYQPNVVGMALDWYQRLWDDAQDFREELLELLRPPSLESDPQTVFLRALLELYGADLDDDVPLPDVHALTPFQRDGLARAKRILDSYGGVLYADGVGMGKTEIGVQLILEHTRDRGEHVLVISPAQLRDRLWEQRLAEENLPGTVVSYQQLAQDRQLSAHGQQRVLRVDKDVYRLVVIDEAHAYRNVDNTWYAALDRLMGGTPKKLLLLTATPVNNSLWDLHNLFLLFGRHDSAFSSEPLRIPSLRRFFGEAGASGTERLSEAKLFPLIDALTVRRDRAFIEERYPNERFKDGTRVSFPTPELHERRYDLDGAHPGIVRAVFNAIDGLTMARYRPSAYRRDKPSGSASEDALAGLMQSQLLKRFESSWYAALQTVKRMRDGNDALLQVIAERGSVPPPDVVRDLAGLSGEDDSFLSADLIDEALADSDGTISSDEFTDRFVVDLRKDRDALAGLALRLQGLQDASDPKLDALRAVMAETPSEKVAIFTAFQDTAAYLKEQIERQPDLLANRKWTVVIGSQVDANARTRELERFCPLSVTDNPEFRPADGEVDVLLSTDILSEGQNLQQAQAVLSFDMPWNPQRVVQRNGRVIRLRSPHDTAYLYTLLPRRGDLNRLLRLEAKLQAKIMAANASVGMETPVLADVESESLVFADLNAYVERLEAGDASLLNERETGGETGSAFAGELFRAHLRRAAEEGEVARLQGLPWGIGAAFVQRSPSLAEPAVFFACRTRRDERYWRMISESGDILHREDLPMLRLIDPGDQFGHPIPEGLDLERLFSLAADDICEAHNALLDPEKRAAALPASQRWALDVLRSPDAPGGREFDEADQALSVGRNNLVRRQLSTLRRDCESGGMSVPDCARRITDIVNQFGLRPVPIPQAPDPITEDDLGVVCYQVVLPA